MRKVTKLVPYFIVVIGMAFFVQLFIIRYLPNGLYRVAKRLSGKPYNTFIHPPKTNAKLRKVVLPNPDFIYSALFYDVSNGDVVVSGEWPDTSQYACIGFYGNNLQPYYVVNNRHNLDGQFRFRLTSSSESPTDMSVVKAQSEKGSILIRMLVTDSLQIVSAHHIQQGLKIALQ